MYKIAVFKGIIVCTLLSCFVSIPQEAVNNGIVNNKVERTIDVSSQLVKISTKITLENAGKSPVAHYLFTVEPEVKAHLAYIGGSVENEGKNSVKISETEISQHPDKAAWKVTLRQALEPGKETTITVEVVCSHMLIPYPAQISQGEKQLVLYHGNHHFFSPYHTRSQTTTVQLPSHAAESYTKLKPVAFSEGKLTYGPYETVPPFSQNKLTVHYENNAAFLSVMNLERWIEVSHWGVISIEEVLDVRHTGALLKGPFSRYEYQRETVNMGSVKSFKTILPASASDVYYRDEIGNISTSHLSVLEDSIEVDLRPRFPLFGGWKTHYVLGYYVPTYEYLFNSGENYALKIRFVDHIFDDSVVEDAVVKVILPEGAKDIQLKLPYPIERRANQLHYTYLDTIGRPVVTLHKKNLVENHIQDFEVHYKYEKLLMLQEPLLVVLALYLLFIMCIIYVRMDFTIAHDPQKESRLKVSGILESVQKQQQLRSEVYARYETTLTKFKSGKDLSSYQASVKKLNGEHKNICQAINDLLVKLKQEGSDLADKVSELQRLDKSLKEQLQQQMGLVEKLISGNLNKQQFVSSELAVNKKKEELAEKITHITTSL